MKSRTIRLAALLAATLVVAPSPSIAQTISGSVEGTLQDSQGGRLPGVSLELRSTETGQLRTTVSNGKGFFQVAFVPIGRYRLTADLAGFGRKVREIEVRLNSTSVVDLTLSPAVAEEVVVTADAPRINTTSGTLQSSLTSEQIMEKPTVMNINNVNQFLSLAETFAGFQENPTSGQNNPTSSSGSSINFNGTGTRGATFQINGVNNDDYSENQNRQGVPLATIKEFQVVSNSYSAEFGRGYGAVVLVQTKQGTNAVKGEVYASRQDNDWNERAFFNPAPSAKPINSRNVFGAVVGAPIIKDNPPLIYHLSGKAEKELDRRARAAFAGYRASLPDDRRVLIDRYEIKDYAVKVVGVGSVGTFCAIVLLMASEQDPLFLQVKEARPSVLEAYAGKSLYPNHGQRVVAGYRLMQSASDIFLGWTKNELGRHLYVRQLKDMKVGALVDVFTPSVMVEYAKFCGWALARAHARSGEPAQISGYLGKSDTFDRAIADFAVAYADQSERDHAILKKAVRAGQVDVVMEPA